MDDLLWLRVLSAFGVDAALAGVCGVLLSGLWLDRIRSLQPDVGGRSIAGLRAFSVLLMLAACLQFVLLTISFSGQTSFAALMRSMPDVCTTHAGTFSLALCGVALALCAASWIRSPQTRRTLCGALVLGALCLRADSGHAASDGNLSIAQMLQLVHLLGMAAWSGGVVVSGLLVVPRLQKRMLRQDEESALPGESSVLSYLDRLSVASTWAVGVVLVSGLVKAYLATDANLHLLRSTQWGNILVLKSALVGLTVLLGARNRWLLTSSQRRSSSTRSLVKTLRVEAIAMLAVLLLSAWLANTQPPLE